MIAFLRGFTGSSSLEISIFGTWSTMAAWIGVVSSPSFLLGVTEHNVECSPKSSISSYLYEYMCPVIVLPS